MVVAGEASGDMHAAALVSELRRRHPALRVFGCGGPRLASAGCEILVDAAEVAVVGLLEVVRHLPGIYVRYRRLLEAMRQRRPVAVVLVDFPDFNLRLACHARNAGLQVAYFISPQLWAWREGRVETVRRCVTRMLCIFPFEREFYRAHRIDAPYVGHPLVDTVRPSLSRAEFIARHGFDPHKEVIALLPGSRRREIEFHLPRLLAAASMLAEQRAVQFVLPVAPTLPLDWVQAQIPPAQRGVVRVLAGEAYDAVAHARVAIVSSGTATVETALIGTPMVVVYRLSKLTYALGRRFVHTRFYSMVNLILGEAAVPELIQAEFQPQTVVNWTLRLATEGEERARMCAALSRVRERLGPPGAISRAADLIETMLST